MCAFLHMKIQNLHSSVVFKCTLVFFTQVDVLNIEFGVKSLLL